MTSKRTLTPQQIDLARNNQQALLQNDVTRGHSRNFIQAQGNRQVGEPLSPTGQRHLPQQPAPAPALRDQFSQVQHMLISDTQTSFEKNWNQNVMEHYSQLYSSAINTTNPPNSGKDKGATTSKSEAFKSDFTRSPNDVGTGYSFDADSSSQTWPVPLATMLLPTPLPSYDLKHQWSEPIAPISNAPLVAHTNPAPFFPTIPQQKNSEQFSLPSTMIPPTVLTLCHSKPSESLKGSTRQAETTTSTSSRKRKLPKHPPAIKPQKFLEELHAQRGVPLRRIPSDDANYDAVPSALQLASFGTEVVKAVHTSDTSSLSLLLRCGLSPNPSNQFRDSILDLVCKRANQPIFECLMKHGSELQVSDGFGRTPLHHACWANKFCAPIVEQILQTDPIQLYIEDKHGQTPLEYIRDELADVWVDFLENNVFNFLVPPPILRSPKDRRPEGSLVDPPNSLPPSLAALVSSGQLSPEQLSNMDAGTRRIYERS